MKRYETAKVRNVALVGHGGAGKTTLAEAALYCAGAVPRLGRVEDGTTTTDFDEDEIKRRMSLSLALAFAEWKGHKLNLADTPGASIFLADARAALRAADAALVVVSAAAGVKVQTEKAWGFAGELDLPRLVVLTNMDRERADFARAVEDVRKNLASQAIPLQLPIGAEAGFVGVVDLLRMKGITYPADGSGKPKEAEVPADLQAQAEEARAKLVEVIAESDDKLLEKYLEAGELAPAELAEGLRRGLAAGKIVPILCAAPYRNIGVTALLDLLVEAGPSPLDRAPVLARDPKAEGTVPCPPRADGPLAALVFKTLADPFAGKITLFRVFSGILGSDATVLNSSRGTKERVGQLLLLRGKQQTPVEAVEAGDLGAVVKLKETGTGDTLCDEKTPLLLPPIAVPSPVIEFAIEPRAKGDEDKMGAGLARLREEDPTLKVRRDPQTKEMIIAGMGKAHVEIALERLKRKFGVEVSMKPPRVPYKETIHKRVDGIEGKHKKQTGGRGQFGVCWIKLEPLPRGAGREFVNQIVGGVIPRQYIPAVEKGIVEAMERGALAGYPVVDVRVILYDGKDHPVDSSELAFKLAGRLAFRKGVLQANPGLLEPIMTAEVVAPDECMGDIIGDLNSKRGRVLGIEAKGRNQAVKALVPLAEMLEYDSKLRSITGDRGDYTMEFSHYEEVPPPLQERVVAEAKKERAEEEEE